VTPRYIQIAAELQRDIARGEFPVGTALPAEGDLSEKFGVSRFTIREAYRLLNEMGLVQRRQGTRTVVTSTAPRSEYRAEFTGVDETVDFAPEFTPRYLDVEGQSTVEARGPLARFLRCRPGREWRIMSGPRRDGKTHEVAAYCEMFLWEELAAGDPFDPGRTIASQVAQRFSLEITEIQVELSAVTLSDVEAKVLESRRGSPGLQVVRRFFISSGRAFEVVRNVFPGELVNYSLSFHRRNA
jgi:DNA-binding GntR family transcriptional regulator